MVTKKIRCPSCGHETNIDIKPGETKIITCPSCGDKGRFSIPIEKTEKTFSSGSAITVNNLTKKFNGIKAVDNVSFEVKKGEIFGFLGPNGAGKTTTIKSILSLINSNSGNIKINGIDIKKDVKKAHKYVGYLPEKVAFYDNLTAIQNMHFYAEMKQVSKKECLPLIEEMGLKEAINKKVGKYSKGMQQRLGMARALLGNPSILILDEPSGGLDPRGVALIRNKIREAKSNGSSVFVSSHILSEIQSVCDRVGIINRGSIVAVDSISQLSNRLKLKPKLSLELEEISDEIVNSVKKLSGIDKVDIVGKTLEVSCDPKSKSKVILAIEKAGGNVLNIQTKEPSLEEVFMKFTEVE